MHKRSKREIGMLVCIIVLLLLVLISLVLVSGYILKFQDNIPMQSVDVISDSISQDNLQETSLSSVTPTISETKKNTENEQIVTNKNTNIVNENSGLVVSDNVQQWTTETEIELFKAVYDNQLGEATVVSATGDEVIAPGTSNKYNFVVSNTGDTPIMYNISTEVEAYAKIGGEELKVPIEVRLNDHTNRYLFGSENSFADIYLLDGSSELRDLSADHHDKYTYEWQWPFERGDDAFDTMLGDLAVDDEIVVKLRITVVAEECEDAVGGIPNTGDSASIALWTGICVCSAFLIVVLLFTRRREEDETEKV